MDCDFLIWELRKKSHGGARGSGEYEKFSTCNILYYWVLELAGLDNVFI